MDKDYDSIINERAQHVFDVMAPRTSDEDLVRLRDAFELAREAHAPQVRKTGEPYILHPIAVASIAAEELNLDVNSIIAAFLHDVVEDTPHPIEEISTRFGDDVAFLVNVLTKKEKKNYDMSKQVDNFKQILTQHTTELIHPNVRYNPANVLPDTRVWNCEPSSHWRYAPPANVRNPPAVSHGNSGSRSLSANLYSLICHPVSP